MNKFLIKEIFKIHGGVSGLTEKVIYENQAENDEDNISVFSSASEETFFLPKVDKNTKIKDKAIKVFSKEKKYIIVARNGKAGLMGIIENIDFTINDHAYILEVKKNFIGKIDLEYFISKYQKVFLDFVTSKDSNGTFSKEIAENYEVIIEPIKDIAHSYAVQNKSNKITSSIKKYLKDIDNQLSKIVITNKLSKKFKISNIFNITSGVRIVKEEVYNNPGTLPIVSAQTDDSFWYADEKWLSTFTKNGKSLIFDIPCISWVCVGRAGTMFYRDFKFYLTDNAGVLTPKNNKINLKWFIATYQEKIRDLRQGDRQGQSTMFTEHMANIEVEIPVKESGEIDIEQQNIIYAEYKRLLDIKEKLESIIKKYS